MTRYCYAECVSDLPSDHVETDEAITFGGRGAAEAIAGILRGLGYRVEGPMEVGIRGWDLDIYVGGKRIWLEVQNDSDEFFLQTEAMVGLFGRLFGADLSHYRQFMQRLNKALRADSRFKEINWFATVKHQPVGEPLSEPPV